MRVCMHVCMDIIDEQRVVEVAASKGLVASKAKTPNPWAPCTIA